MPQDKQDTKRVDVIIPTKPKRPVGASTRFQPGDPRINRTGSRPRPLTKLLEKYIAQVDPESGKTNGELIINALGDECVAGNVKAIEHVFNRVEGAVPQAITGPDEGPISIELMRENLKRKLGLRKPTRKFRDEEASSE